MRPFSLVYRHRVDNYLDPSSGDEDYDFIKLQGTELSSFSEENYDYLLVKFSEIKKIIIKDFRRILENVVHNKKDNESLAEEMKMIIDTYDNDIDYTEDGCDNFITLTEDYLYFNNVENAIDELLLGSLGDEADVNETLVIVNRKYSKFYFITFTTSILTIEQETTVKVFEILEDRIDTKIFEHEMDIRREYCTEDDIQKILTKINELK